VTEPTDTRPRVVIPIKQIETLAMAIDFAYAQALDPGKGLPYELPPARIQALFPKWREAGPQELSMLTAILVLEWLSGHKVISRGHAIPHSPRTPKPPGYDEAMAEIAKKKTLTLPPKKLDIGKIIAEETARAVRERAMRKCGHCGLQGLKTKTGGTCLWCGEKARGEL
jgi:hypothetical protein